MDSTVSSTLFFGGAGTLTGGSLKLSFRFFIDGLYLVLDYLQGFCCCSGDTRGVVEEDWRTVRFDKVNLCSKLFGLRPWYGIPAGAQSATPEPEPAVVGEVLGEFPRLLLAGTCRAQLLHQLQNWPPHLR